MDSSTYVILVDDSMNDSNVCIPNTSMSDIRNFIESNSNFNIHLHLLACSPMIDTFDTLLNDFKDNLKVTVYSSDADYLTDLKAPNLVVYKENEACQTLYDKFVSETEDVDKVLKKYIGLILNYYKYKSEIFWDFDNEERKETLQFKGYLDFNTTNYTEFKALMENLILGKPIQKEMEELYYKVMNSVRKEFESNNKIIVNSDVLEHRVDVLIPGIPNSYQLQYLSEQFNISDIRCTWYNFDLDKQRILLEICSISARENPDEINSACNLGDYLFGEIKDAELTIRNTESNYKAKPNRCFLSFPFAEFSNFISIYQENL